MRLRQVLPVALLASTILISTANSKQPISYLGYQRDGEAVVQLGQGPPTTVRVGDDIAEYGTVEAIDEEVVTISRKVSEDEQAALKAKGALAPQIERARIPRDRFQV